MKKEKPCTFCGTSFRPRHGLERFDTEECRKQARAEYKQKRHEAGLDRHLKREPGEKFHPRACSTCGNIYQPRFAHSLYCQLCKQQTPRWTEDIISSLLRSAKTRRPEGFELTRKWFDEQWERQSGCCSLSGEPMTRERVERQSLHLARTKVSIDRIEQRLGYTQENSRLVCLIVNLMRNTMTDDELVLWCDRIRVFSVFEKTEPQ